MKIYYIWDAYCGWSYGFNQLFKDFMTHHPDLQLKLISGGLFVDEFAQAIRNYPHMTSANQAITALYGTRFGDAYQTRLAEGELILDSTYPATAFALMRDKIAKHAQLDLALAIQEAFFQEGKSLSDTNTYLELARRFGLSKPLLRQELEVAFASQELAKEDFEVADLLGVQSFPTVILELEDRYAVLDTAVSSLAAIEAAFQKKLAELSTSS